MATSFYESFIIVLIFLLVLLTLTRPFREFRRKHAKIFLAIQIIPIVYFSVKAIRTGDKYYFALAAIVIAGFLIGYFKLGKKS